MELVIDFETRSKIDIKKAGAYRYAEDESTEVLMLAVKVDGDTTWVWVPFEFESFLTTENYERLMPNIKLEYLITHASVIHAHNAPFERVIWREIMHKRHGFPDIPLEKWSCTAARAANAGLPRDLARACQAAGCPIQKDDEGHKLMLKMCKPRKPTKSNPAAWHMNEADFNRLLKYCIQDVDAEHALGKIIPEMPERERKVWLLDQTINDRGVAVDLDSIDAIQEVVAEYESRLLAELHEITDGVVDTAKQVAVLRGWLAARGVVMDDLQRQTVEDTLAAGVADDAARRVLEIRQCLNKSSLAKLEAMRSCACSDGRVRGSLLYCGAATTKRWAGRLIQPQNLPRGTIGAENVETALFYLTNGGEDCLPWELMASASACIRSLIVGDFVCGDFSAIEARITAWLADELVVLTAFREGKDIYKVAASGIYGVAYDAVDKPQRQIGKVSILALGFAGGVGAFQSMAKNYGVHVDDEKADLIVKAWRQANQNIVKMWYAYEGCMKSAIRNPGEVFGCNRVKFLGKDNRLHVRLPSGGILSYIQPKLEECQTPWGQMKEMATFMSVNPVTNQWERAPMSAGCLTENIVQATARDMLVEAMFNAEAAGARILMTVHDEILAEGCDLETLLNAMRIVPEWADGFPLDAAGWEGKRYRKD